MLFRHVITQFLGQQSEDFVQFSLKLPEENLRKHSNSSVAW